MRLWYRAYELPFQYPFTISKGTKTHQPTLITALEHLGHVGVGEAPAITYYNISTDQMVADLERKKIFVEKFAFTEPERYWHYLHHLYPNNPFLVCALDIAGWDLYGKMKRKPVSEFWKPGVPLQPVTDYTIGIDTIEKMVEKLQAHPWPVYKIKLGTENDIAIMEALRKHTDAPFRVDANAAWTVAEAVEKIAALKELNVEFVEQPLAKDDWEGMKRLMDVSPLPLIADESCVLESDVERCAGHFHGINIKLTKCSGITPALRMIRQARALGMKVMIGSMNESSVGSAAIVQLSYLADYVDADGPLLLSQDLASGLTYQADGTIITSGEPGLGITFHPDPV
ncbi:MAG: dipeptide epimerase [Chitinophagaceae bacterium]|nr:MAG: dipeptide epimerase [Chitinophagaceae bacterium]